MSDLDNVIAALNLEYGANRRYAYQIEHSPYPQLNAILEGVRRTEGDHIEAMLAYVRRQQSETGRGRGFASMLTHLHLNLEFERAALVAYGQFARESEDQQLKKTFQSLSLSEAGHLQLFKALIEQIEANTYPVAIYCPVCGWELHYGVNPSEGTVTKCEKCKQSITLRIVDGDFTTSSG